MPQVDFSIAIGGAAGQGIATPGDILAKLFARRGLNVHAYNAYQSIIRGGHILLTLRVSDGWIGSHGDKINVLVALNQDTMDRHLQLMQSGTYVLYDGEKIQPGTAAEGVRLCPIPVKELSGDSRNPLVQNTQALAAIVRLLSLDFEVLEDLLVERFKKKSEAVIKENVDIARMAYNYAKENFTPATAGLPEADRKLGVWTGNTALAMGGVAAGVNFYCAYPMSPSTGILMWMAAHARKLGMMVRQAEDEIAAINMTIGAAHAGCRAMCATSGGGFALMTEAIGMAGIMEIPVVCIDVQRGGPSTGLPTKTEQGDLWQALGASQGDFPKIIVSPTTLLDYFNTIPEVFNLAEKYQCPAIVLAELLLSEGTATVPVDQIKWDQPIERGALISTHGNGDEYWRYKITDTGISPRALPGLEGYVHVVASDEHDQDGTLLSDEFTNPHKRQAMMEKRQKKMEGLLKDIAPPELKGVEEADVTLVGWGSTEGVIQESIAALEKEGILANHLHIKWIVPFHAQEITNILTKSKKIVIVEVNYTGQFARYLRSETGLAADGHIRKYDGEPLMPHHIVNAVKEQLAGETTLVVPVHEIMV